MAKKKAKIKVSVQIYDASKAYVKFVEKGLAMGLRRGGIEMEGEIKRSMKKGKIIKRKKRGPRPVTSIQAVIREASNPGDPPAVQTGDLRASIGSQVVYRAGGKTDQIVLRVGTIDIEYAKWLEEGTSEMAARPFVGPKSDTWKKFITDGALMDSVEAIWKKMLSKNKNLGKGKKV